MSAPRCAAAAAVLALALATGGCGLLDSRELWSSGRYVVLWIDAPDQAHLAYRIDDTTTMGLSDPCVSAVAENADYIAVEQRPPQSAQPPLYRLFAKRAPAPRTPAATPLGEPMPRRTYEPLAQRLGLPPMRALGGWDGCGGAN
ncbi:hypothetical protein [Lysobacter enzymogenes]|uniref:Lipoprotein n=1 Tax=Lysobacter enzymogenes TaxID=69 RepID=A0A3N2RBN3_LYSEN|nr:hypothetical protein [Lysobacter enzymogenes]ROU04869.1 hypothetical protein D9T17_22395 [Lysobacter enzymogenes]